MKRCPIVDGGAAERQSVLQQAGCHAFRRSVGHVFGQQRTQLARQQRADTEAPSGGKSTRALEKRAVNRESNVVLRRHRGQLRWGREFTQVT